VVHNALREIRRRGSIHNSVIVFWFCLTSTIITLFSCLGGWQPMTGLQILIMLLAGLSSAAGQFLLTAAFRYAPPKEISVFDFTQILFSAVMGLMIFGQIPTHFSMIAYAFLILASLLQLRG
jgi:drug/metabolite transporter (DMT)-like permease